MPIFTVVDNYTTHLIIATKTSKFLVHLMLQVPLCRGTIVLESCLITTNFRRELSREQNTRLDDEEENTGTVKSKVHHGTSG